MKTAASIQEVQLHHYVILWHGLKIPANSVNCGFTASAVPTPNWRGFGKYISTLFAPLTGQQLKTNKNKTKNID